MFSIRYATEQDEAFWYSLDRHMPKSEYARKVRDRRAYVICDGDASIGVLRYNLFWDIIPFLTLIHLHAACRGKGFGRQAMMHWENEMRALGHKMTMTSTQVDEQAQYFYRTLGYRDRGALFLDHTPFEQPEEMLMLKVL